MGRFFKIFLNLSLNWLKFKKILEKSGDFAQNLAQNWSGWYMNGSLFLEKLVFVWFTFKFRSRTSLPKSNLSIPQGFPIMQAGRGRGSFHVWGISSSVWWWCPLQNNLLQFISTKFKFLYWKDQNIYWDTQILVKVYVSCKLGDGVRFLRLWNIAE